MSEARFVMTPQEFFRDHDFTGKVMLPSMSKSVEPKGDVGKRIYEETLKKAFRNDQ